MRLIFTSFLAVIFTPMMLQAQEVGTFHSLETMVDGQMRTYKLYEPAGHDGSEDWPVVFVFHGFGAPVDTMIKMSEMHLVADTAGFLVVYPQGLVVEDLNFGGSDIGWLVPTSYQADHDDVRFVGQMIEDLDANPDYAIDRGKVYASGWSNGGEFSLHLACTLSDQIASVASIANPLSDTILNNLCVPARNISTVLFLADQDPFFPADGQGPYASIEETGAFWAGNNGCDLTPLSTALPDTVTTDTSTVTLLDYPNCGENSEVKIYRINGGGHAWPGGYLPPQWSFLGRVNRDIHASVEAWKFFQSNPNPNPPGRLLEKTLMQGDSVRSYLLYVPDAYDGTEDWPLVINYHGYSQTAGNQVYVSAMNPVADTGRFLVAYPQGLLVFNPFAGTTAPGWNVLDTLSVNNDFDFTFRLIDSIAADYQVDPLRVHATGWSMGSSMAWEAACRLSDRIASVAGVSNQMTDDQLANCNPRRPMSSLYIHGTDDPVVPYNGVPGFFSPAIETASFWARNADCSPDSMVTDLEDVDPTDTSTVTLIEYTDCYTGTEVLFYRINGGGHGWPGGGEYPPSLVGRTNRDINASSEIWNFFQRNPHPIPPGRVLEKTLQQGDSVRSYLLYVSDAYDGSEDWPLVINIHGYALDAGFQLVFSQMNAVADTGHFLVAYPQGTLMLSTVPTVPPQGLGFNISGPDDTTFFSPGNVDDVDFISSMMDQIESEYEVDKQRIFSTGFSNGGAMSFVLACELGDRIAAIAPVAAPPAESRSCPPDQGKPKPVFLIFGSADSIIPYETGGPSFISVPEVLDLWADINGCEGNPQIDTLLDINRADSTLIERQVWSGCEAELVHYRVVGGGHQWPGGVNLLPFLGFFNQDINASSEIWNFFQRNPLQEVTSLFPSPREEVSEFKVFPNPFRGWLRIEMELQQPAQIGLTLFSCP